MNNKNLKDEHLEGLWHFQEKDKDSLADLKVSLGKSFDINLVEELVSEGLVELKENRQKIMLTSIGADKARQIIRAHRIAERMMHDVLGNNVEDAACEFEHTIATELVDSICTLLGHPKECPHGKPIPEGECCKILAKTAERSVISLTELKVGDSAKIAYVHNNSDQQLHKFDSLHIRPGAAVKLHQNYPTYVIECEDANIALDKELAAHICVWRKKEYEKLRRVQGK